MLRVTIQEKNGKREELSFDSHNELTIGRVPNNDIPLPKNNVSKRHAKVFWNNGWELQDMKSTNGTFVNGQQVDHHRLAPGDQVIIGDFLLTFDAGMDSQPSMGMPSAPGMGMPPAPGIGMPPAPGIGMPPAPGMGMPPAPGMPLAPGMNPPGGPGFGQSGFPPAPGGPGAPGMRPPVPPSFGGTGGMPHVPGGGMPSAPGFPPAPGGPTATGPAMGQPPMPPAGLPPTGLSQPDLGPPPPKVDIPQAEPASFQSAAPEIQEEPFAPAQEEAMETSAHEVHHEPSMETAAPEIEETPVYEEPVQEVADAAFQEQEAPDTPLPESATHTSMDDVSAYSEPAIEEVVEEEVVEESVSASEPEVEELAQAPTPAPAVRVLPTANWQPASEINELQADEQVQARAIRTVSQHLKHTFTGLAMRPLSADDPQRQELAEAADSIAAEYISNEGLQLDANAVAEAAVSETAGWGPLEGLLSDDTVSAIFVSGFRQICVERNGEQENTGLFFSSNNALQETVERVFISQGVRLHRNRPMAETRLPDGTWVHAVLPPVANHGLSLVVQPPRSSWWGLSELQASGLLHENMAQFLINCIHNRCNIVISGDPGSGRTTLLRALANEIPHDERIVSIENVPEIQLDQPYWVSLVAQTHSHAGEQHISTAELVSHAARMRAQRTLLGDLQGDVVQSLLPQMVMGLNGVLASTRANSPDQMIDRLSTALQAARIAEPHQQLGQSIDIVVQLNQFACGTRKITSICEFSVTPEGSLVCQEIFSFHNQGINPEGQVQGSFAAAGIIPIVYQTLAQFGQELDTSIFQNG